MTFGEVITEIGTLIDFKSTKTEGRVRTFLVRALRDLSHNRASWNSLSSTWMTSAGVRTYAFGGASGLPTPIYVVLDVWPTSSGFPSGDPLEKSTVDRVRASTRAGSPGAYARFGRSLVVDSAPIVEETFWVDYLVDGRYDATNALITTTSDASTNLWLEHGVPELEEYVLAKYCLTVAKDAEAAAMHQQALVEMLDVLGLDESSYVQSIVPDMVL